MDKKITNLKRSEIILCTVLVGLMALLCFWIGASHFSREEVSLATSFGEDFSKGWRVETGSGKEEVVTLPYCTPDSKIKHVKLIHAAPARFAGKTVSLRASNAIINVYLDGRIIYQSGSANGLANLSARQRNAYVPQEEDDSRKEDIGHIFIEVPKDYAGGSRFVITLDRDSSWARMTLYSAGISESEEAVVQVLQQSLIPIACGLLILSCAVLLQALDVIRMVNNKRTRGLVIIALFAFDVIFYSFVRTDLFYLFFGNRRFFLTVEELSYIMMPVFLTGFYFRGFKIHFPRECRVLFYTSVGIALADLVTYSFWGQYRFLMYHINMAWRVVVIALLMKMLVNWYLQKPEDRRILMDECALASLLVSVLANAEQFQLAEFKILIMVQMLGATGYFVFMMAQHVQIMVAEMQYMSRQRVKTLKEQNLQMLIANREAEEARQEAIEATKAKSRFLANMSHEIRTPINAVLGMDEMILRESDDDSILEYAQDIKSAGRTLLSLINDILDFSKIESGGMEIVPVEYDIEQLISDLVNMIARRAEDKGLSFQLEVDESIPRRLYGDDIRIRQCVMNLLTNAVKYTQKGEVCLSVRSKPAGENVRVEFVVSDTGIGIPEEEQHKLFMAYERIEESRNRNIEGTGLGMNITLQMLRLMDSRLEVDSVYGEGSTFAFELEQGIIDEEPLGKFEPGHRHHRKGAGHRKGFIAPSARILVTDDNSMNRKVLISLLARTQISVDEAESGEAAIEKAKANAYDLIFMDHMMPNMDGIEAMQIIRGQTDFPNAKTKIYVLTANAVSGAREMYLEAGFDGFLSKPVMSDQLEKVLREQLPADKVLPAPEEGTGEDVSLDPEELPLVDGLDWSVARQNLPQMKMLAETICQFYELIDIQADKLEDMFQRLPEEGMLDAYRIHVHGMKGLAMTVGIIPLAGMAKVLEFAARDEKTDVIQSLHPIFEDEWRAYKTKLVGVFGIRGPEDPGADNRRDAAYPPTLARLTMLTEAMEEYDVDRADELMGQLKEYRYPAEVEETIKKLAGAVADLDADLVASLADRIIQAGDWNK